MAATATKEKPEKAKASPPDAFKVLFPAGERIPRQMLVVASDGRQRYFEWPRKDEGEHGRLHFIKDVAAFLGVQVRI